MVPSVSILQQIGLGVLLVVVVLWAVGLVRLTRRGTYGAPAPYGRPPRSRARLDAVPRQTGPGGPPSENVDLTPAERQAFDDLVRQLSSRS
ncbi:hypothetical protein ACFU90_29010 [Streptomyces noursei]|uniref:Uncharacterized protein n=1 Tax=Streptomyces noursei TaxID=1971 RepID=A0A059W8J3_STRNR|nr:hypothetical protein [Streptomyces noursei]AKA04386.1 hypothetical protein SAZ_19440 [Streptomyces noursei ZPM]AIA04152.1 hypothetical protein DC74_3661 [Streptomyces noursei]EOS99172.1 hypothetical protein K530_35268 [Streptomyces noursei CCRC 11814]EXU90718.1 hypothetical protein P354_12370 [Streptomyces noursei PD-1]MCZ0971777.1 hypothetical protein [Streptomyces noursei]